MTLAILGNRFFLKEYCVYKLSYTPSPTNAHKYTNTPLCKIGKHCGVLINKATMIMVTIIVDRQYYLWFLAAQQGMWCSLWNFCHILWSEILPQLWVDEVCLWSKTFLRKAMHSKSSNMAMCGISRHVLFKAFGNF